MVIHAMFLPNSVIRLHWVQLFSLIPMRANTAPEDPRKLDPFALSSHKKRRPADRAARVATAFQFCGFGAGAPLRCRPLAWSCSADLGVCPPQRKPLLLMRSGAWAGKKAENPEKRVVSLENKAGAGELAPGPCAAPAGPRGKRPGIGKAPAGPRPASLGPSIERPGPRSAPAGTCAKEAGPRKAPAGFYISPTGTCKTPRGPSSAPTGTCAKEAGTWKSRAETCKSPAGTLMSRPGNRMSPGERWNFPLGTFIVAAGNGGVPGLLRRCYAISALHSRFRCVSLNSVSYFKP